MSESTAKHGIFDPDTIRATEAALPVEGALDSQRKAGYYMVPEGKRLTEYEQLCGYAIHTNDAMSGTEIGDYQQKHAGGRGAYSPEGTELKSSDWFLFRDPDKRWFFPYVKNKAEEGGYTKRYLEGYSASGEIRSVNPEWLNVVDNLYGGLTFMEYGLFSAHSAATKDCPADFLKIWISMAGFDKNDAAQMIQTQRVFLNKILPSFPADPANAKDVWLTDPIYADARKTVEELWQDTYDWAESIWSVHGVFDPIFGQFVRREFFSRIAPRYGDNLTPWIQSQTLTYFETAKKGTVKLMTVILPSDSDEKVAEHNVRVIKAWTEKWLPDTIKSLKSFMAAYAQLPSAIEGVTDVDSVTASVKRVLTDWEEDYAAPLGFEVDVEALVAEVMTGYKEIK